MPSLKTSSNSYGQFWYGNTIDFPGFLYKKNVGVSGRKSTKFNAGGNSTCNTYQYLYNKYKPGQGGVGAVSISNRRAKNRLASVCNTSTGNIINNNTVTNNNSGNCGKFYGYLGRYNNYTENPNGYFPYPNYNKGKQTFVPSSINYPI